MPHTFIKEKKTSEKPVVTKHTYFIRLKLKVSSVLQVPIAYYLLLSHGTYNFSILFYSFFLHIILVIYVNVSSSLPTCKIFASRIHV